MPNKVVDPVEELERSEDTHGQSKLLEETEQVPEEQDPSKTSTDWRRTDTEADAKPPRWSKPEQDHEHDKLKFQQ